MKDQGKKYEIKVGDPLFYEDCKGELHKTVARAIDGPDVMTDEGEWEKSSTFIKPSILKVKLENAKKVIHEIEMTNDKKRRREWREAKKVVKWLEGKV